MQTILITGATRGLGYEFASQLAKRTDVSVVLAVRDLVKGQRLAADLGPRARAVHLDMADLSSIAGFCDAWNTPLFALINNAGLQVHGPTQFTKDGIETSLAVNHLGPLKLTMGLLPHLRDGVVLGVGSGTHNPNDRIARLFGFRGGRYSSITELAAGTSDARSDRQAGMDRYATSKLAFMATASALARRYSDTRFLTLDPGLMPGTGLVRTAPAPIKWAWKAILPKLVPIIPGASTPQRSAKSGIDVLFDETSVSGQVYDDGARRSSDMWEKVHDPAFGQLVLDQSLSFLTAKDASCIPPMAAE